MTVDKERKEPTSCYPAEWEQHRIVQSNLFRQQVETFLRPIPKDVQQRMERIAEALLLQPQDTLIDVGCGTGAMVPFIHKYIPLSHIWLCDCSEAMLEQAKKRFPECHSIHCDFLKLQQAPEKTTELDKVDVVLCNAVFGNFIDQQAALQVASHLLKKGGRLVVSHPMGRGFVQRLHESNPAMVPHLLPDRQAWQCFSWRSWRMTLEYYCDESELYIARLLKE
jgi:SAM-dependent methyltransferase